MARTLIIGMGEVGQALGKVLACYNPVLVDLEEVSITETVSVMHVCIPYTERFSSYVKSYQQKYSPRFTVIHSTVPVGTSGALGALHSPIRGLHPDLESGIRTFPKFIGGNNASEVADYFRRAGLKVILFDKADTTEAMKLFDTEYYRVCIEFAHRVKKYCNKHELNFHEVYTLANETYNAGYEKLGHPEFVRPVLQPIMKPIGGHCIIPNSQLLNE